MPVSSNNSTIDAYICYTHTNVHNLIFYFYPFLFNSDPPLTEDDIPSGQWLCHNCRMTLKTAPSNSSKSSSVERTSNTSAAAGANSRPNTPSAGGDLESIPLKIRHLRKRSSSRASFCSDLSSTEKYLSKLPVGIQRALDPNKKPTPLDELIKAASILNPKQFELPRELEIHTQFPGNDKSKSILEIFLLLIMGILTFVNYIL